jgi:glycosidase
MNSPYEPKPFVRIEHPEWSRNATIYQLNTRQFTEAGTFIAAAEQLPRLRDLGVDIIWLMPVQPIGVKNRKGSLGSPYAVQDYYGVNPEFGTADELKDFIHQAHALGMYVILDWVANHTAWDSNLVAEHPEWYARSWDGNFRPTPWWNWDDIIDLDFSQVAVREYMTAALVHWVREFDIDGYRCDVAGFVPTDFWETARAELDAVKPVFMLAEWESKDLHAASFDMTYGWHWNMTMHQIAQGHANLNGLYVYYSWNEKNFPKDAYRMMMVSNHDKNAWEGTEFEQFGDMLAASITLSVVGAGMPLIYNGQEAGYDHRLAFFDKDPIVWGEHWEGDLYRRLFALKHANHALWNGRWGGTMIGVKHDQWEHVLAFVREAEGDRVFGVFNLSAQERTITFSESLHHGGYTEFTSRDTVTIDATTPFVIEAWGWRVFHRESHTIVE